MSKLDKEIKKIEQDAIKWNQLQAKIAEIAKNYGVGGEGTWSKNQKYEVWRETLKALGYDIG